MPLAGELAGELERHFKDSAYQDDDDLVFAPPPLGHPLDRGKVRKRFKAAVKRANVGQFEEVVKDGKTERRPLTRFHDLWLTTAFGEAGHRRSPSPLAFALRWRFRWSTGIFIGREAAAK